MQNLEVKKDGNILTITVDLSKDFGASKSGKSIIVATTSGNVDVPETNGTIKMCINIYKQK
jgi:hypothetical protein